jgi:hypothetical protein
VRVFRLQLEIRFEIAACAGCHWECGHPARETDAQDCSQNFHGQDARIPNKKPRTFQFQSRLSGSMSLFILASGF